MSGNNSGIETFQAKEGEASRFCRNFLSHRIEAKSFVKGPFCFPEIFWYREKIMDKRGLITIFSRNFCVSTVPKTFVGIPSMFQKIWGIEKFYA